MNRRYFKPFLLLAAVFLVGWTFLVDNFLGKALDFATFNNPGNNTVPVYSTTTGKWSAAAAPAAPPTGAAGGDLGGTYPNPTVVDLSLASEAQGDLAVRGAAVWARLAAGAADTVLISSGTSPAYRLLAAADIDELIRLEELLDVATMVEAAGDIIQRNAANTAWDKLAIGAVDTFLKSSGTQATWSLLTAADIDELIRLEELSDVATMVEAAGDLITRNAGNTAWDRLAIGAADNFLTSNGSAAMYRPLAGPDIDELIRLEELLDVATMVEAAGDLITRNAGNTAWDRLAIGSADSFLSSNGSAPMYRPLAGPDIDELVRLEELLDVETMVEAAGDIIQRNAGNTAWDRLPIGGAFTFLKSSGTQAVWNILTGGDIDELIRLEELLDVATMTEAAGDLIVRNAGNTEWDRLAVGALDTVLVSNGSAPAYRLLAAADIDELIRLEELSDVATMTEAAGDLIVRNAGNTAWDRVGVGAENTFLKIVSGFPTWTAGAASTIIIQEADATVDAAAGTIDYWGDHFDVVSSPTGEANIFLATGAITPTSLNSSVYGAAQALGTATSNGIATTVARSDHVHAAPSLTENANARGATTTLVINGPYTSSTASGTTNVSYTGPLPAPQALFLSRPGANTISITATSIALVDSQNTVFMARSVGEQVDISASVGANGPDASGADDEGWKYVYIIAKLDGTVDSLVSESATAPVLPPGYYYQRLVGADYNHSDNAFIDFRQRGSKVIWMYAVSTAQASGGGRVLAGGTDTTYTAVDLSKRIPVALSRQIDLLLLMSGDATQRLGYIRETGTSQDVQPLTSPAGAGESISTFLAQGVDSTGSVDYKVDNVAGAFYIQVIGYNITVW